MTFIVDAQLPPSLAAALRQAGCDAVAVREIGLRDARDPAIWRYALENDAAIDPTISAIITDPEENNLRSLNAFKRAGFTVTRTVKLRGESFRRRIMHLGRQNPD